MSIKLLIILLVVIVHHQLDATSFLLPFSVLVKNAAFIDKTSFLREFFKDDDINIIITAPPGFGKTSVLGMIEQFADIELNDNFSIKHFTSTGGWKSFQNTKIAQDDGFLQAHLSQYIVVKLDLRIDLPANVTRDLIREQLLPNLVYAQVEKYFTCLNDTSEYSLKLYKSDYLFMDNLFARNVSGLYARCVLRETISLLYKRFNRKIILLIDNYDHVARGFLFQDVNMQIELFYVELNSMIYHANQLNAAVGDLFKMVIMSTTAIPLEWADETRHRYYISNFKHCRFLISNPFLELVGFTETEVDSLITRFNVNPEEKQALLTYYKAYPSYPDGEKIYCPRSVMNFIKVYRTSVQTNEVLSTVYKESFSERIGFLKEHLNNASRLELQLFTIIANQSLEINIHNFIIADLQTFWLGNIRQMMIDQFSTPLGTTKHVWSYLLENGFLVHVDGESSPLSYRIANQEAQRILHKLLIDHHNDTRLPLIELGKCTELFVHKSVMLTKESIASLFGLVENLLGRCINNTASQLFLKDNELKYQAILYAASLQSALNNASFVVSTMQYLSKSNETYYGVYYYNSDEKNCAIVVLKNSNEADTEKEVFLNEAAASYSLPHANVKHLLYAVVNVFEDRHLQTFFTTYERYYE